MDNVKVAVRLRPLNTKERAADHTVSWTVIGNQIVPAVPGRVSAPYAFGTRTPTPRVDHRNYLD